MNKQDIRYTTYVQILKEELVPAMGCTEPIAIAYAAAKARDVLGALPDFAEVMVSNNIIKNVKSVVVPNTGGLRGIEAATAAGIIAGQEELKLEVLSKVSEAQKTEMKEFLGKTEIQVSALEGEEVFDILIVLHHAKDVSKVRISRTHTNIVYVEHNGDVLFAAEKEASVRGSVGNSGIESNFSTGCLDAGVKAGIADRSLLNLQDILEFADTCDISDVKDILDAQIRYNMMISEEGLLGDYGANIGSTMLKAYGNDVRNRAIAKAAAGSDARMSGCELPVIINSGSGNQGITVSVPVIEYAKELNVSKEKLYRALIISNLTAIHGKTGIGTLSAYCGAVSAGCAAGCGIAYLHGGGYAELAHTLVNSIVIVSGIICDGAKPSCAAKIASSVEAGILGYHMYMNGQEFKSGDGIVDNGVEATIRNVGRLGKDGMRETDKEIVKIMLDEV